MTEIQDPGAPAANHKPIGHYYEIAKKVEWKHEDLPWGELPIVPEASGPPAKRDRRNDMWRNVIMQQLQADRHASNMAAQLLTSAPDIDAQLYYTTMVQDEVRHTVAWQKMIDELGGDGEPNPYLDRLCHMVLEADSLPEKVFLMQGFFEKIIIPKFRLIRSGSKGTVLAELCSRLIIDDTVHHMSGVAYERELLENASKKVKAKVVETAAAALPVFVEFELWRPTGRTAIGRLMEGKDRERILAYVHDGKRLGGSLGLDFSEVPDPDFSDPATKFSVSMNGIPEGNQQTTETVDLL